jgi:hypothetical protein
MIHLNRDTLIQPHLTKPRTETGSADCAADPSCASQAGSGTQPVAQDSANQHPLSRLGKRPASPEPLAGAPALLRSRHSSVQNLADFFSAEIDSAKIEVPHDPLAEHHRIDHEIYLPPERPLVLEPLELEPLVIHETDEITPRAMTPPSSPGAQIQAANLELDSLMQKPMKNWTPNEQKTVIKEWLKLTKSIVINTSLYSQSAYMQITNFLIPKADYWAKHSPSNAGQSIKHWSNLLVFMHQKAVTRLGINPNDATNKTPLEKIAALIVEMQLVSMTDEVMPILQAELEHKIPTNRTRECFRHLSAIFLMNLSYFDTTTQASVAKEIKKLLNFKRVVSANKKNKLLNNSDTQIAEFQRPVDKRFAAKVLSTLSKPNKFIKINIIKLIKDFQIRNKKENGETWFTEPGLVDVLANHAQSMLDQMPQSTDPGATNINASELNWPDEVKNKFAEMFPPRIWRHNKNSDYYSRVELMLISIANNKILLEELINMKHQGLLQPST